MALKQAAKVTFRRIRGRIVPIFSNKAKGKIARSGSKAKRVEKSSATAKKERSLAGDTQATKKLNKTTNRARKVKQGRNAQLKNVKRDRRALAGAFGISAGVGAGFFASRREK